MQVSWGAGGVPLDNPHVQRLRYCELLVKDFLQRLPGGRFNSAQVGGSWCCSQETVPALVLQYGSGADPLGWGGVGEMRHGSSTCFYMLQSKG